MSQECRMHVAYMSHACRMHVTQFRIKYHTHISTNMKQFHTNFVPTHLALFVLLWPLVFVSLASWRFRAGLFFNGLPFTSIDHPRVQVIVIMSHVCRNPLATSTCLPPGEINRKCIMRIKARGHLTIVQLLVPFQICFSQSGAISRNVSGIRELRVKCVRNPKTRTGL